MRARGGLRKAKRVLAYIVLVDGAAPDQIDEQPAEQRRIGAGRDRQEQVGLFRRHRAARVDHHDAGPALGLVAQHALEQHRVTPGGVRADEHDQVGLIEVAVDAGHGIGPEGAAMAGNGRCHAQSRIGVDIGRPQETLHQLVGDVVVLGQQLAGEIERNCVWSVTLDDVPEAVGHAVKRTVP